MANDPLLFHYFHQPESEPVAPVSVLFQHYYDLERFRRYPSIRTIGWERRVATDDYRLDCSTRQDPQYAYQYTVSGEGAIEIDGQLYRLPAGSAFFIRIPSHCVYYLPPDSSHWEFKFIGLTPNIDLGHPIENRVFHPNPQSDILALWDHIYKLTIGGVIQDFYQNSSYAYPFFMELLRHLNKTSLPEHYPIPIRKCVDYIEAHALSPIGLDDMVKVAGITRFHLTRLFKTTTGDTPFQYLIKIRINKAAHMLVQTSASVDEIALSCGFTNGNYFAKVFRRLLGTSPSQFRTHSAIQDIDIIRIH